MSQKYFIENSQLALVAKRILYGVLNWGLGHASRSSVIIDYLLSQGAEVVITSDGLALGWLRDKYPQLEFRELPAYAIRYPKSGSFGLKMLAQLPKIFWRSQAERRLCSEWTRSAHFDLVISDNRLGFYSPNCPSLYLSHQLKIHAPPFSALASLAHRFYRQKYSATLVPDDPKVKLSGQLSEEGQAIYCGFLSHLKPFETELKLDILVLLSGPEPQRSLLEEELLAKLPADKNIAFVRGAKSLKPKTSHAKLKFYEQVNSAELSELMRATELVICRSGYSSLMDLYQLRKKALLIPTPQQGEQEYLAQHLAPRFLSQKQGAIDLSSESLKQALAYPGFSNVADVKDDLLSLALRPFLG